MSGCVEPIMSCAGIKTSYPRCAKFCTHDAVATCEASVQATIRSLNDNFQSNMRNIQRNNSNDDEIEAPIENVCIDCESGLYSN